MKLLPDGMNDIQATAAHDYYLRGTEVRRPLRVGVLLDGYTGAAWVEHVLKRIIAEDFAEIVLVIINDSTASATAAAGPRRSLARRAAAWWRNRHTLGYELYQRLDERRYQGSNAPGRPVDLTPVLAAVPVLRVRPRLTRFCDYFEPADLELIAGHDLDVALRFGFRILRGEALQIARHGVWSYHHGDNTVNRGGPAGFWEVMEQHEVTGAVLQRLTEDLDGGEVLARSYSSTNRISASANRANYYWQATELVISSLRQLAGQRGNADDAATTAPQWSAYSRRLYTRPGSIEMLGHFTRLAMRLVAAKLRHLLVREQWLLAYRLGAPSDAAGAVPDGVFYRFRELQPPPDRFWADPFAVSVAGRHYIFFEEQPYDKPHAHICVAEVDADGIKGEPRVALKRPYHLSYPSVFAWQGEWYMTPETQARNAVELFRAVNFPDEWEYAGNLIEGMHAVDPTIALINDRWWMFAGVAVAGTGEATALHLFSAPNPLGPWQPHARNPVKIDVRGARPGGQVFQAGGRYYRVGQDGTPSYGSGLRVFVIDQIDDDTFSETEVERIRPDWRKGLVGMHTLNAADGITVIDLRQERRRF